MMFDHDDPPSRRPLEFAVGGAADWSTVVDPVIAFDLGGTWFRSGIVAGDKMAWTRRFPAIGIQNVASSAKDLQDSMVQYVVQEVDRLRSIEPGVDRVGISLGAAMNHHTGEVLASGPLWGSECPAFFPADALKGLRPNLDWAVVNDVTALALDLTRDLHTAEGVRVSVITVSTGIAERVVELNTRRLPLDPAYGLQGEIGHLPAEVTWDGRRLCQACDCGALNHVSSYASGSGLERLFEQVAGSRLRAVDRPSLWRRIAELLARGHPDTLRLLDAAVAPLAHALLVQATVDPDVRLYMLAGGVISGIGAHYRNSLLSYLDGVGIYGIKPRAPRYFADRIVLAPVDGMECLRGAALYALSTGRRAKSLNPPADD